MRRWGVLGVLILCGPPAWALDHDNLDAGRPLAIEDAYAVAKGEIGVESGFRIDDRRGAGARYGFAPRIVYGIAYNTQLEVGGRLDVASGDLGSDRSGDGAVGLLYNLNTETLDLPAMALKVELEAGGGARPRGLDASAAAIATRTFGRWRTHLNAGYTISGSSAAGARRGRYGGAVGANYPLGYPLRFRETFVVDAFTHQSEASGAPNTTGLEVGIRHQLSPRIVLDVGVGTETSGPADRSAAYGTVGFAVGF
jgi:hypothetical protein